MPLYVFQITIPKNTTIPITSRFSVQHGIVDRGYFFWPEPGADGLAGITLYDAYKNPISPINGTYITAPGKTLWGAGAKSLGPSPWAIIMQTYNNDDTWPHTVEVGVEIG